MAQYNVTDYRLDTMGKHFLLRCLRYPDTSIGGIFRADEKRNGKRIAPFFASKEVVYMTFHEQLIGYMEALKINGSQLALVTGMTQASISRYKTGTRVPAPEGEVVNKLAKGLATLASDRGLLGFEEEKIAQSLSERIWDSSSHVNCKILQSNLDLLMKELGLSGKNLADATHYDTSQIYRIRNGKRNPSDPASFVESVVRYVLQTCTSESEREIILGLIGWPDIIDCDFSGAECFQRFCRWLSNGPESDELAANHGIRSIEPFELHQYFRHAGAQDWDIAESDDVCGERRYEGKDGFVQAMLDFMSITANGTSCKDVYIYSDFPVDEHDEMTDKPRKYVQGIVEMVQQGLHINTIHRIDRAFNDMMFDFSLWLPLYMSGRISPYYLEDTEGTSQAFRHIIMVSGHVAMYGMGMARHEEESNFVLTRNKSDIAHLLARINHLLQQAKLLFDTYDGSRESELMEFLAKDVSAVGDRLSYMPAPPVHTMSDDLMNRILERNEVSEEEADQIRAFVRRKRDHVSEVLKHGRIKELIARLDEGEITKYPPRLSLPGSFMSQDIAYTYDEYVEHWNDMKAFAYNTKGYELIERQTPSYRNITITIHRKKWVIISRANGFSLHLLITQPTLCGLIENAMLFV